MRRLIILTSLLLLAAASPAIARVGVPTRSELCNAAILSRVQSARVGTPPKPIPRVMHGRARRGIRDSIDAGQNYWQARTSFLQQLSAISNEWWRRDLAEAAAEVVGNPPSECR